MTEGHFPHDFESEIKCESPMLVAASLTHQGAVCHIPGSWAPIIIHGIDNTVFYINPIRDKWEITL